MVTITLPPELELAVAERARQQGTTPELWTLDRLRESVRTDESVVDTSILPGEGATMLDFLSGYTGVLHSSEFVHDGAQMSQDIGRKFADGMVEKHRKGKL